MEDITNFQWLLKRILKDGGESADIYYEKRVDGRIALDSDRRGPAMFGFSEGIALRLFKNSFCGMVHIESPEESELLRAADFLRNSTSLTSNDFSLIDINERKARHVSNLERTNDAPSQCFYDISEECFSGKDGAEIFSSLDEIAQLLKDFLKNESFFSINASFYRQNVRMMNSDEIDVRDLREGALLRIKVSFQRDLFQVRSEMNVEFSNLIDLKRGLKPNEIARKVAQSSFLKADSVKAPQGEMPLILSSGSGGVFLHETVGHLFEGDNPLMNNHYDEIKSHYFGKDLSVFDDPSLMIRGRYRYDDEGIKGRRNPLIISGRLAGLLHSIHTAKKKRTLPSGNGRRQSFRDISLPRMSAVFMENGDLLPEDIIRSVNRGIFASGFGKCTMDESNGNFFINVTEGNVIRNGKIEEPISGAILMGNAFEVLKSIELVGNDLNFDRSGLGCTKFGQTIPSSVGTPTMKIGLIKVISQ